MYIYMAENCIYTYVYMAENCYDLEGATINFDYLSIVHMMLFKVTYYLESQ